MKKITAITASVVFMTVLFSSCKKEKTPDPQPAQRRLVRVELTGGNTNTHYFTYNAQGRLAEQKNNHFTMKYDYSGTLLSVTTSQTSTAKKLYEIKSISATNGKVTGFETKAFNSDGSVSYTQPSSCQYNSEGQLTGWAYSIYNYVFTVAGGITTKCDATAGGAFHSLFTYEYYTDKADKLNLNWFEQQFQNHFLNDSELFGKKNKQLLKKVTQAYAGSTYVYDFNYTLDAEGYVSGYTMTETQNGVLNYTNTYTFYYQ